MRIRIHSPAGDKGEYALLMIIHMQDQGAQHEGDVLHGQEHDGVRGARGGDHRHPPHHSVQCKEGGQLLYSTQGQYTDHYYLCCSFS